MSDDKAFSKTQPPSFRVEPVICLVGGAQQPSRCMKKIHYTNRG